MILLKQKRKTYTPPEIEVTEYEEEVMGGGITGSAPDQPVIGPGGWGAKSTTYFDDDEEGYGDDYEDDWNYENYKQSMLW